MYSQSPKASLIQQVTTYIRRNVPCRIFVIKPSNKFVWITLEESDMLIRKKEEYGSDSQSR